MFLFLFVSTLKHTQSVWSPFLFGGDLPHDCSVFLLPSLPLGFLFNILLRNGTFSKMECVVPRVPRLSQESPAVKFVYAHIAANLRRKTIT